MTRDFTEWFATFRDSIADYSYYVDFEKVHAHVDKIKVELNILNSLIASNTIKEDFKNIINTYPTVLKCIPLLLAVRLNEIYVIDADGEFTYNFKKSNYSVEQYCVFMEKTGLFNLLEKHIINNLVDYVTGVETGLDSNARKNRGGKTMENLLESYIQKAGFVKDVNYFKEMKSDEIENRFDVDLAAITNQGQTTKRFDFVIYHNHTVFGIETNFYSKGGSKLNETARSYKNIAIEAQLVPDFKFMWFTDGKGWHDARNNLKETFDVMEHIYNIKDLENNILKNIG